MLPYLYTDWNNYNKSELNHFDYSILNTYKTPNNLVRIGPTHDGGYVIADGFNYDLFISCGIANDIRFEEAFLDIHPIKCIAFDGTINSFTNGKYSNSEAFITGTYDQILNNITDPSQYEGMSDAMKTERSKANDKLITQFKKENDEILKKKLEGLKDGDEERVAQANLSFIENRMKYSQANSNKFEDRVNQYDVISAERDTKILKLVADPRQIKINYERIKRDANQNFGKDAARYVQNAGRINDVIGLYPTVPWVQTHVARTQQKSTKQSQQPDVTKNLMEQFYGVK